MDKLNDLPEDPQKLAERCAEAMYAQDPASQQLGMEIVAMAPGRAELRMAIQPWMLNGHQTCHGGMIFALADTAFAFACNSENHAAVAASCSIDYIQPGRGGDTLTARACQSQQGNRTGIYDVQIENQRGELVALFRGRSHRIATAVIPGPQPPVQGESP